MSEATRQLVVLVLSVVGGLLVIGKGALDLRQARRELPLAEVVLGVQVVRFQPRPEEYDDEAALRTNRLTFIGMAIFGFLLVVLWIWALSDDVASLVFWLPMLEFALGSAIGAYFFTQLRGKKSGEPVDSCEAQILVKGEYDSIAAICRSLLVGLGAVRTEGAQVKAMGQENATFSGGTGPWPMKTRGERIIIRVQRRRGSYYSIHIESATFWPGIFHKRKNRSNVRKMVQAFLS